VERFFHDPSITNPVQCICDICMTVEPDCIWNPIMRISGGKWIVYPFDGKIQDIFETLQGVFRVWLPQSGYKMMQRYGMNLYRHIDRDHRRVIMDLCIPIS
jgi:AraC family transcriptional regulator